MLCNVGYRTLHVHTYICWTLNELCYRCAATKVCASCSICCYGLCTNLPSTRAHVCAFDDIICIRVVRYAAHIRAPNCTFRVQGNGRMDIQNRNCEPIAHVIYCSRSSFFRCRICMASRQGSAVMSGVALVRSMCLASEYKTFYHG